MDAFFKYIFISTFSLSVCYLSYIIFLKKERKFEYLRFFLLTSMVLSMTLPLLNLELSVPFNENQISLVEIPPFISSNIESISTLNEIEVLEVNPVNSLSVLGIFKIVYFLVLIILVIRLLISNAVIFRLYFNAIKKKEENIEILLSNKIDKAFTFFRWVFIPYQQYEMEDNKSILIHESIHAAQNHSGDLLFIEILIALMWFNPFVWKMKNLLQLVHEYLADEGVLNKGINKLSYQTLLINQVAEGKLISLSSSFNNSPIKKRIIMMKRSKTNSQPKFRILVLIPLTIFLITSIAFVNGQSQDNMYETYESKHGDILYQHLYNPIRVGLETYSISELEIVTDNGTISSKNGNYMILPKHLGTASIIIRSFGKEVKKIDYKVVAVPDPVLVLQLSEGFKRSGDISKEELLNAKRISIYLGEEHHNLDFEVVSFAMDIISNNQVVSNTDSKSGEFTKKQIGLIKLLKVNQEVVFSGVLVKGPDGTKRTMPKMNFIIRN